MKKFNFNKTIYFFALIMGLSLAHSCSKTDTPSNNTTDTGSLTIEFENIANGESLTFDKEYTNAAGEKMKFSRFDYYISNIVLWKTDGTSYTVPRDSSYFLIKDNGTINSEITLNNIPFGDYNKFSFVIGVDSLKNTEPASARVGDLNTGNGMYWSWNSGYIFLKTEGTVQDSIAFKHHIGLQKNVKNLTFTSNTSAKVSGSVRPTMHFEVDLEKMYNGTEKIDAVANRTIMVTPFASNVATNFPGMFILHHVHN
jgi:hypothetical protein